MISPSLPGPETGSLSALLPGAAPAVAQAGLRGPGGDGRGDPQATDFASFISFLSGAGQGQTPAATLAGTGMLQRLQGTLTTAAGAREALPAALGLFTVAGRLVPATGKGLPPGLPLAAASSGPGAATDMAALRELALTAMATTQGAPASAAAAATAIESLTPMVSAYAGMSPAPAPWLRALLPADRNAPIGELLSATPGDAITSFEAPQTPTGANRPSAAAAPVLLPTHPSQLPAFEQALGERLALLVREGRQDARIRLHPAELGTIDIRLSLDGDATRISLASPHAAVRDALELAVPRLRELLDHAGFDLSQVDVGAGDARSHGDFGRPPSPSGFGPDFAAGSAALEAETGAIAVGLRMPQGLVDTFA